MAQQERQQEEINETGGEKSIANWLFLNLLLFIKWHCSQDSNKET